MEKEDKRPSNACHKSHLRVPAKASFYYIMSAVIGRGVGILVTPIFTRVIDTSEYGYFSYYISVLSILSLASTIFLSPSVIYSGLGRFKETRQGFENSAILLSLAITPIFCLLLFAFNNFLELDGRIIVFIVIQISLDLIVTVDLLSGKFFYDYTRVVAMSLLSSFLAPIISLFLILIFDAGANGRIYGLLISAAFIAAISLIKRLSRFEKPQKEHITYLLKNSIPLFPGILARAVMGWSDKLVIKGFLGVEALAKYSVAHTVGMALFGIIGALSSALNPWIIRKLAVGDKDSLMEVIKNLGQLVSFGSVFIIGLAPELLSILAPKSYNDSLYAIIPFAISTIPYFLFNVFSVFITYQEKTKFISIYTLLGAAVNLVLNLILIKSFGYIGGGISYLFAESLIFVLVSLYLRKNNAHLKVDLSDQAFPFIVSLAMALVLPLIYPYLSARLIILIIPACFAVNRGFLCLDLAKEK